MYVVSCDVHFRYSDDAFMWRAQHFRKISKCLLPGKEMNVLFETAVFFAERWRHLTYSNEPNLINNALLVAKEYFHFKLSNVTKRATVACAQCASRTAVLACSQCASRTEAPSNGLRKYHRRERTQLVTWTS